MSMSSMSLSRVRPTIYPCTCRECEEARGGCSCGTDLSSASPSPGVSGLNTPNGGFDASYYGLFYDGLQGPDAHVSPNFGMGTNWLPKSWAYWTTAEGEDLAFIWGPGKAYWFRPSGENFTPRFGAKAHLAYSDVTSQYTLTEQDGTQHLFDADSGYLVSTTTPGGQQTVNEMSGDKIVRTSRTVSGVTEIREYTYFGPEDPVREGMLKFVTLKRSVNPEAALRRIEFDYYGEDDAGGPKLSLSTVAMQVPEGDQWVTINTRMFRYYRESEVPNVEAGLLKGVLDPEGYRRLAKVIDPHLASDDQFLAYSSGFYYYASFDRRLQQIQLAGGTRTYGIQFSLNVDPQYVPDYNTWRYKSVVTHPDGYVRRYYANHVGQEILNVKENPSDANVYWATYTSYWTDDQPLKASYVRQIVPPRGILAKPVENTNPISNPPFLTISLADGTTDHAAFRLFDYFAEDDARDGYLKIEKVKDGSGGTEIPIREYEYEIVTGVLAGDGTLVLPSSMTEFPDPDTPGDDILTEYEHVLFGSTGAWLPQVKTRVTTLPVVPSGQNGDEATYTRVEEYDIQGRLIDSTDEKGIHTTYGYDNVTGARIRMTEAAGVLNLVTDYFVDDLARTVLTLSPVRSAATGVNNQSVRAASFTVFKDALHEVWTAQGFATGTDAGPVYNFTLVNPVSIRKMDHAGRTTDEIAAVRGDTEGALAAGDSFPQSSWVRWTRHMFNNAEQGTATRVYHTIPAVGSGDPGVNYDETTLGYDIMGRRNRVRSPGGTIARTVFDPRDLPTQTWIGTNDAGASDSNPAGPSPALPDEVTANNMVLVTENIYDGGFPSASIKPGDGLISQVKRYATPSEIRFTNFAYDFRDRQIEQHAIIHPNRKIITATWYDNLDRVTFTRQYDTEFTYNPANPPPNETTNLIGKSQRLTDKRGRVYRTLQWSVSFTAPLADQNFSTFPATIGDAIEDNTWFDGRSQPVKQEPAGSQGYTKTVYDTLRRAVGQFFGYSIGDPGDPDPFALNTSDKFFTQVVATYDESGNAITTVVSQRNQGNDTIPTDPPAKLTPNISRVSYSASWFDGANRQIAAANYGTNANQPFSRPATPPESGADVLVTNTGYNERGEAFKATDPSGTVTRLAWDDAGRSVETIQNYQESGSGPDVNVTTRTTYTPDGGVATLTAVNPVTGDQTTHFLYGTTLADSGVARSDLLVGVVYPDAADGADRVSYQYNRQADRTLMVDQNGTEHQYFFDGLGRVRSDVVTALGEGVDGAVRRVNTSYEIRGMAALLTNESAPSGGTLVNQVALTFNGFGQLTNDGQKHSAAAGVVNVGYDYEPGAANTIRRIATIYPHNAGSRTLDYVYGTAGDDNDKLSRVSALSFADGTVVQYGYFGAASLATVAYPDPTISLTFANGATYNGFDQFGRVIDVAWLKDPGSVVAQLKYGYDLASNRTFRRDIAASILDEHFDEFYTYDGMHRLKTATRGQLYQDNAGLVGTTTFGQTWQLDPTGNWDRFTEYDNQGPTFTALDQTRTQNEANEIEKITLLTGQAWHQPGYDRNGNMTTMPRPGVHSIGFSATYDAWNRLVELRDAGSSSLFASYQYDALNRRTIETAGGTDRHFFYSDSWQILEERLGSSSDPDRQFVWGLRYIDDCVLRDRNITSGILERLYALQDANWNVAAFTDASGDVIQRLVYDPYGESTELDSAFDPYTGLNLTWEFRFTGQKFDYASGLYLFRMRYYHSALGAFISCDPRRTDPNLYLYVGANPLVRTDPYGLLSAEQECIERSIANCDREFGWYDPRRYVCRDISTDNCRGRRHVLEDVHDAGQAVQKAVADVVKDPCKAVKDLLENDWVQCACGLIGVADLFSAHPAVELGDCVCNMLTTIQTACDRGFAGAAVIASLTALDCFSTTFATLGCHLGAEIGGALGGAVGGFGAVPGSLIGCVVGFKWADTIIDSATYVLQNLDQQGTWWPKSQGEACCDLFKKAIKI